jgi:catechol 2,3-dioxygenase-like lactoylglutathione lyase family enzyme
VRWSVTVFASDYAASKAFYRDTLGMDIEELGPDTLVARRDGLEVRVDGGAKPRKRGRSWMQEAGVYLTLETDDFQALHDELERRGARFLGEISEDDGGKRYAGLADPDGLLIEIAEA